jgi:hypothetical protein
MLGLGGAASVVLLFAAACGSRTGLDAEPPDEPADASAMDAPRRDGAVSDAGPGEAGRDAGPLVACPALSDFGFRLQALGTLDVGLRTGEVSVGGDGRSVYLAVTDDRPGSGVHLYFLDGASAGAREIHVIAEARRGRVTVENGIAHLIGFVGDEVVLVEARAESAVEVGRSRIAHGTRLEPVRPVTNGSDVVVGGSNFFGPLRLGEESTSWIGPTDGSPVGVAAQPETGITELLRSRPGGMTVQSFDRAGSALSDPVMLDFPEVWVGPAFGWLDADGTGQPIVVAGASRTEDGSFRVYLQRFRSDGSAAGGFSATAGDAGVGNVDLTTVPVPPHEHGYGMVAGLFPGAPLFHGAGQDFVGDGAELPVECSSPSIAAGRCGYVIACAARSADAGAIELVLAVPPAVRR